MDYTTIDWTKCPRTALNVAATPGEVTLRNHDTLIARLGEIGWTLVTPNRELAEQAIADSRIIDAFLLEQSRPRLPVKTKAPNGCSWERRGKWLGLVRDDCTVTGIPDSDENCNAVQACCDAYHELRGDPVCPEIMSSMTYPRGYDEIVIVARVNESTDEFFAAHRGKSFRLVPV